ncbi:GtrA family protein [Candidatus Methylopumilus universalis]|uniref:GtrA family protein n=1 Tax=Candidatus Methylopumilus universalis TaxID=2588536 RepID=UPI003BEEC120
MKVVRYFFVGGISAIIDISLFAIFASYFKFPWAIVSLISFIIATLTNYFLSIKFVFKSGLRFKKNHEILGIFVLSGLALILNQMILYLLIEKMSINLVISKCITMGMLFLWNYYGRKIFIFSI